MDSLDAQGNPTEVTWCTVCPLNMHHCTQGMLKKNEKGRSYPKWSVAQNRFGESDYGKEMLIPQAQAWYDEQGGNPDGLKFCSNSGRKSLGKWCAELHIKYSVSFQLHGDLWSTWQKYYQHNLHREPEFQTRDQSQNLDEVTEALWKFARWIGRGRLNRADPTNFDMNQIGRLMCTALRAMGRGAEVANILGTN